MPDIVVAADESAATELLHDAEAALGTKTKSGSGSLGPFNANWSASAFLAGGTVDLITPNVIRLVNCELHYSLNFTFSFDLSNIIPDFCLPQVCIKIPFIGKICTPGFCINWPTITIPVSHSDLVKFTADFTLNAHLSGSDWLIDVVIGGIPNLQISAAAAAILAAVGVAAAAVVALVPFIGLFLAGAILAITTAIGIAGVTGLLGPILSLFVSGLSFNIYKQPRIFNVVPAMGALDPAVNIRLDSVGASVSHTDEDELVIAVDISA
ncbi:MAG TPA: hypothetical protein VLB46_00445 [Pyrinomonadaceae bacterium]|nr:hypothetical protein [Pyrinomonadaceae bacterium]